MDKHLKIRSRSVKLPSLHDKIRIQIFGVPNFTAGCPELGNLAQGRLALRHCLATAQRQLVILARQELILDVAEGAHRGHTGMRSNNEDGDFTS